MALFGLFSKKNSVECKPGRGWTFEVVGESNYQRALSRLAGGKGEFGANLKVDAELRPEPKNKFDKNAVVVTVSGKTVGYLPRDQAPFFGEFLQEQNATSELCSAKIVGGWDRGEGDEGHFGVKLNLAWPPKVKTK